jgi:hypothetical protein
MTAKPGNVLSVSGHSGGFERLRKTMLYAADIRAGRHRPHPRNRQALAQLVGVSLAAQVGRVVLQCVGHVSDTSKFENRWVQIVDESRNSRAPKELLPSEGIECAREESCKWIQHTNAVRDQ